MSDNEPLDFFHGGGEMGERMRALNWPQTPLGPAASWPQALKTAVSIVLNSRYAMFVWWGGQLINLYNDAYRPFLGAKHPASLGQSARDVWSEIWHLIGPRADAVLERGEATFDEALLLIMDRYGYPEETYFTFSYSPIREDRGHVGGIFCAVTDETSRIIGERRLKLLREVAAGVSESHTSEQVCAAVAETVSGDAHDLPFVLLYLIEKNERPVRFVACAGMDRDDPAAGRLIGMAKDGSISPLEEAIASNEELIIDDLPSWFERPPNGAWDRPPERAVVVPLRERGQTGTAGLLVAGLNPYLPYEEGYRGFIRLFADQIAAGISNARAYEEERRRAEALAEIDRAKTAFFSNISHEFRTPLTLMLSPLEQLLAKPGAAPDERSLVSVAHRNGVRLLRLVNNLLDFSRIEAGRVQASYERTDLAPLTAELVSNFHSACERAGLSLSVDCSPLEEPVYVDRDMWEKIVLNLVSNAFKFTLDGGIKVTLAVEDGHAILRVTDTGTGIPETELPLIFDRFHRVDGAGGRTHEGTGIGLALVQELVKLHQGSINVESTVGLGTTFIVRIPLGSAHLPVERIAAANAQAGVPRVDAFVGEALRWLPDDDDPPMIDPAPVPAGQRPRVLLADDNADMRQYLSRLLATGYEVTAVANGKDALAAVARGHPDVILTDVMMPGLDGFALLQQLKADPELRDIPVILLSAQAGEEAKVEGLGMGASDYLVKPFNARDLLARVSSAVDRRRTRNALREEAQRQLESRYRLLVEAVTEYAIYMLDADGVVTSWNPGARRFKGYEAEEIIGQHFSRFYTEEDRLSGLPAKALATADREGKFEGEGWRVRKNGERFWANVIIDPIRDPSGRLIGYAKVTRDLTERLEAQRALEKARERTTQSQKMEAVGQLTGGVAHDFNNLLTAILGSLELLQRRMPAGQPQLMRLIDNAISGAERGAALTQRMLAFARRQELNLGPVDIPTLVRGMSELLQRSLGPSILIDTRFPLSLARVTADPNQLEMAVLNLVVNARDAMQNGGTIVISARPVCVTHGDNSDLAPGKYVCLSVEDTGEGMDEATLIRAIDPFFTTKEPGKGTGLGLSMVQGLAEQSGGRLFLKSLEGEGTTAELWLPVAVTAAATPFASEPEREEAWNASLVVLVVDDDSLLVTNMVAMLEDLGHRVLEASSGRQALEILNDDSTIDLVITDHVMPGMTGLQLIKRIKAERADLPVILATGYAELPPDADPALPRLAKPFRQHDLAQAVSNAIRVGPRPASRVVRLRQPGPAAHKA